MRRLFLTVLSAAIITLAFGASAQARPWAHCHNFSCVNKRLNSLHRQAVQTQRTVNHLNTCLLEAKLTEYGDPTGPQGYVYTDGSGYSKTSALDLTQPGDPVTGRFLFDSCAGTSGARAIAPMAPLSAFSAFQTRSP